MESKKNKQNKLFLKQGYLILFFLITYFLFIFNVNAADFNYAEFKFDQFAEDNLGYWTNQCAEGGESEKKCKEKIISKQKKYYTRLYKILAEHQKNGDFIDDNIIITTTFFGLSPDVFNDSGENYDKIFGLDRKAYNYADDLENYNVNEIPTNEEYFENETDTLDLLIRNFFSYGSSCYAVYGDVSEDKNNECPDGGTSLSVDGENKCAIKDSSDILTFIEYAALKINVFNILNIFGMESDIVSECKNQGATYPGAEMKSISSEGKTYNEDAYWEFLETSNYFDKKPHLKSYYGSILKKTNKKSMDELTDSEYKDYENDIIAVRKDIIKYIKDILKQHGSKNAMRNLSNINNSLFWWPIGGSEITESNGVKFAIGEPVTYEITSQFGPRSGGNHHGLDIGGIESGTINVIASRSGIVEEVVSNCTTAQGADCGVYGNYVVLSHGNGIFTRYAHLHDGSVEVIQGQSVEQGQVLGKMGSTGYSTGTHLHFEVMVGSNSLDSTVNPLSYISSENPRSSFTTSGGVFKSYMDWEMITAINSKQYVLQHRSNVRTGAYGIREYDGMPMVAVAQNFGNVGDVIKITLSNGNVFNAVIGDQKAKQDVDKTGTHLIDKSIVEMIVDTDYIPEEVLNRGSFDVISEYSGEVINISVISNVGV